MKSGKTELALRRLVRYLPIKKQWPTPCYFYAGPTFSQAKRTAWNRLKKLIPPHWIANVSETELTITTTFGSELLVTGLDRPERLEGSQYDGGVIDENSDIKPGVFDLSILPAMVWRNGWCWFIGVPKRYGVGAVEYRGKCDAAAKGELPDSAVFQWSSEGIVPQDYLELCRKTMDARDFDEQFNARWLDSMGGIFYSFDRELNIRPCIYEPNLPLIVSSDFNVNPMCWIVGHLKGEVFEVVDEIWMRDTNTPATIDELVHRYGNHKGGFQFYGDASSKARKTSAYKSDYVYIASDMRLQKLGRTMHYVTSNPPVADRFAATNARICNGAGQRNVFIDPKCKHLIHDLEIRTYKSDSREPDDSGDIGHPTDAIGYFLYKRFPLNLIIPNRQIITLHRIT